MAPKLFAALGCIWEACDFDNILVGCKGKSECLCLTSENCCAVNEEPVGVGLVTNPENKECCKLGFYCCAYGLKMPERLCASADQICCIKRAGALPPDSQYNDKFVLSYYCLTCAPECGCCIDAPDCPALEKPMHDYSKLSPNAIEMERDSGMEMNIVKEYKDTPYDGPALT